VMAGLGQCRCEPKGKIQISNFKLVVKSYDRLTVMTQIKRVIKPAIRYSEAFKVTVVRELEEQGLTVLAIRTKYGIKGAGTVESWLGKYGNGTRGKRVLVQTAEEIDEFKAMKNRMRHLETLLADANVALVLERGYLQLACQRAGIADVAEFKKKTAGTRPSLG
jgi:transposase